MPSVIRPRAPSEAEPETTRFIVPRSTPRVFSSLVSLKANSPAMLAITVAMAPVLERKREADTRDTARPAALTLSAKLPGGLRPGGVA